MRGIIFNADAFFCDTIVVKGKIKSRRGDVLAPNRVVLSKKHHMIIGEEDISPSTFVVDTSDGNGEYYLENQTPYSGIIRHSEGYFFDRILPHDKAKLVIRDGAIVKYHVLTNQGIPSRCYSREDLTITDEEIIILDRSITLRSMDETTVVLINQAYGEIQVLGAMDTAGITLAPEDRTTVRVNEGHLEKTTSLGAANNSIISVAGDTSNTTLNINVPNITEVRLPRVTTMIERCQISNHTTHPVKVIGYELGSKLEYNLMPGKSLKAYIVPIFGYAYTKFTT